MLENLKTQDLILEEKIIKKTNLLICIPTFNSFETTSQTIEVFLKQKDVSFDLMITGPEKDTFELKNKYPLLNYAISKENYGHAGHELINIFLAQKYEYEYVILNDNDSRVIENNAIFKMYQRIKKDNLLATFPIPYLSNYSLDIEEKNLEFCPFHTCLFKIEIFKEIPEPFLQEYFISFDDVSFLIKLRKFSNRIKPTFTPYTHPSKPNKFFSYSTMFYQTRSYLIFMLYDKASFFDKFYYLILFRPHWYIPMYILYSIINFDFTYFKILPICIYQVLTKKYQPLNFKKSKFEYETVENPDQLNSYKLFNLLTDVIIPKKYLSYPDEFGNLKYLKLYSNN